MFNSITNKQFNGLTKIPNFGHTKKDELFHWNSRDNFNPKLTIEFMYALCGSLNIQVSNTEEHDCAYFNHDDLQFLSIVPV